MKLKTTLIKFRNSFNSWKRVGTIKDFPKDTERLFQSIKQEVPAAELDSLRCEVCTEQTSYKHWLLNREARELAALTFIEQSALYRKPRRGPQHSGSSRLVKRNRKMSNTGLAWKFNLSVGLLCKHHNTIILPIADIEQMIAPFSKDLSQYKPAEKPKKSTRCHDNHPHCSICGLCHHNRRTHNNGHLRF